MKPKRKFIILVFVVAIMVLVPVLYEWIKIDHPKFTFALVPLENRTEVVIWHQEPEDLEMEVILTDESGKAKGYIAGLKPGYVSVCSIDKKTQYGESVKVVFKKPSIIGEVLTIYSGEVKVGERIGVGAPIVENRSRPKENYFIFEFEFAIVPVPSENRADMVIWDFVVLNYEYWLKLVPFENSEVSMDFHLFCPAWLGSKWGYVEVSPATTVIVYSIDGKPQYGQTVTFWFSGIWGSNGEVQVGKCAKARFVLLPI